MIGTFVLNYYDTLINRIVYERINVWTYERIEIALTILDKFITHCQIGS
jgi:hypothetical protein